MRDIRYALRSLSRARGFAIAVILTLGLGIGANTALFSAVNGLLLQTIPVQDPEGLVRVKWAGENDMVRGTSEYGNSRQDRGENVTATFSFDMYQRLRAANQTTADLAALAPFGGLNVVIKDEADIATATAVTGLPGVAYPNRGEAWDNAAHTWVGPGAFDPRDVRSWMEAGAQLVGGCCRVGEADIAAIAEVVAAS